MPCQFPRRWLTFALLALLVLLGMGSGAAARAQPVPPSVPPVPPWQRWFDAVNAGDVAGVIALMRSEPEEDAVVAVRCAGGCLGMAAIEEGIARLVADGYWGEIDLTSVQIIDGLVSFDVAETAGVSPVHLAPATTRWTMELDGDLIVPACPAVCLRSPAARAVLLVAQAPPAAAGPVPVPRAGASQALPTGRASPSVEAAAGGVAGPTPAPWVVGGLLAALLGTAAIIAASAAIDGWRSVRRRAPRAP